MIWADRYIKDQTDDLFMLKASRSVFDEKRRSVV